MVFFHIGVNFFGGGTDDVSKVEFEVVAAELEDADDDVVVEVDLGIALTAATGKPEDLFQGTFEAGAFSFVGLLLDSEDG